MPANRTLVASATLALLSQLLACQDDGEATTSSSQGTSTGEDDTSPPPTTAPNPSTTLPSDDDSMGPTTTSVGAASESDDGPGSSSTDATSDDGDPTDGSTSEGGDTSTSDTGTDTGEDTSGQAMQADVSIVWSNVQDQVFCFYYSGPDIIGDEALWEANDGDVTLTFPPVDIAFPETMFDPIYTGAMTGSEVALEGVILHEFNGAPWQTTETFTGTLADGVFTGTYLYEECDPAVPATCPGDGFCTITADFVMTLQ